MSNRDKAIEEILAGFQCIKRKLKSQVHHSGLTHAQWVALASIRENEWAGIKKIAETLWVSSSAATQLVDELERNDFVIRRINPEDKREVHILLSEKARTHLSQLTQDKVRAFAELFSILDDQEFDQYVALNKKITSHI